MKFGKALFAGVLGAVTISVVTAGLRAAGLPTNFELILGSLFTLDLGFSTWLLGLAMHIALGAYFALLYAAAFEYCLGRATWGIGSLLSLAHMALSGVALMALPAIHPLIPEVLTAPGPLMVAFGWGGILSFVVLHLLYGAIVGGFYGAPRSVALADRPESARVSFNP